MTEHKQWLFLSGLEWEIGAAIGDMHEDKPDLKIVPINRDDTVQNLHDEGDGA
jgi:hypothetical protein